MRRLRPGSLWIAATGALCLCGCDLLSTLTERLNILAVDFTFDTLDVSGLVYTQDPIAAAQDFLNFDATARHKYGVNIRCRLHAHNPNAHAAVFDGAAAFLRVEDTTATASAMATQVPGFRVEAQSDAIVDILFPLRLDNPVFSQDAWTKVIQGGDMPYRVNADLFFNLLDASQGNVPNSLGNLTVHLDVAKGSVDARQTSLTVIDLVLQALGLVF
jgi:hypothetical protein